MALHTKLSLLVFKQTHAVKGIYCNIPKHSLGWIYSTTICSTHNDSTRGFNRSNPIHGITSLSRTNILPSNKPYEIQAIFFKSGQHDDSQVKKQPNNDEMNLRHSVENDYLSWMRNSYMMTLAGLTILNTASLSDNMIISKVVFFTACLNLTFGTLGYLHSLSLLRKREVMRYGSSFSCQLLAILHWLLWVSVLLLIINPNKEEEDDKGELDN